MPDWFLPSKAELSELYSQRAAVGGFVDAVWITDDAIHHKHAITGIFSKPDKISGNFELRRLTTTKNKSLAS